MGGAIFFRETSSPPHPPRFSLSLVWAPNSQKKSRSQILVKPHQNLPSESQNGRPSTRNLFWRHFGSHFRTATPNTRSRTLAKPPQNNPHPTRASQSLFPFRCAVFIQRAKIPDLSHSDPLSVSMRCAHSEGKNTRPDPFRPASHLDALCSRRL